MKYLSLFSGIGGFELGIGNKHECVGYSEINKYAIQIYEKHFKHKNYGDITKINVQELPDFDLIVGGFPCQSFSIAGKRMGFEDTRGTLFFEIAKIIRKKKPRFLLLENVKGLLSHDKGETFRTIISTIDELGYDCQWQVLNSKNHGVPQNRERVFIVGHLRGTPRPKVFPIGRTDEQTNQSERVSKNANPRQLSRTLLARDYKDPKLIQVNNPTHSNDRVYSEKGISPTLNTMQGGNRQPFVASVLAPDRLNKRQNGRRIKENGEPSFTLTSQDRHGVLLRDILENPNVTQGHIDYETGDVYFSNTIRRLTPVECERLQGFPDNWTEYGSCKCDRKENQNIKMSDTQRYKTLGNAVTVNVVRDIMIKLMRYID